MQIKLKEIRAQLKRAVWPDAHLRVFYCGTYTQSPLSGLLPGAVDMGLVFKCNRGTVDLSEAGICGTSRCMRRLPRTAAASRCSVPAGP